MRERVCVCLCVGCGGRIVLNLYFYSFLKYQLCLATCNRNTCTEHVVGGIFHFYSIFDRNFCKQTVENLIRRRRMSEPGLHYLPMSHKKDARLMWVK